MSELDELRNEVDAADDAILAALKRRFDVTDRIRALKAREGLPRVDAEREREILARVAAAVPRRSATPSAACGSESCRVRAARSRRSPVVYA